MKDCSHEVRRHYSSFITRQNLLPLPGLCRFQNRVSYIIRSQAIREGGRCLFLLAHCLKKVGHLVNEGVLIADLQPGDPPVLHVGMIAIGDVHALPSTQPPFIAVIEILQPVQVMQIPRGRRLLAVHLNGKERLMPARIARSLERGHRSVGEAAQERGRIINANRLNFAGKVVLPFFHERLRHGCYLGDGPVQPQRHIDVVGEQVAGDAAARYGDIQTPQSLTALRQVPRDGPILQELRAIVEDTAETSFVQQLLEQHDCRHTTVVIPNHVGNAGGLSTASVIVFASAPVRPSGFSQSTILPALAAAMAISAWVSLGLAISIRSISFRATRTRQSVSTDW